MYIQRLFYLISLKNKSILILNDKILRSKLKFKNIIRYYKRFGLNNIKNMIVLSKTSLSTNLKILLTNFLISVLIMGLIHLPYLISLYITISFSSFYFIQVHQFWNSRLIIKLNILNWYNRYIIYTQFRQYYWIVSMFFY